MIAKQWFVFVLIFLSILAVVRADVLMPVVAPVFELTLLFLIAIVLIEAIVGYFLLKKAKVNAGFWFVVLVFFVANIVSTSLGIVLAPLIPLYAKNAFVIAVIPAFILSVLIEWPVLYWFLKNRAKQAGKVAFKISLWANIVSYFLLAIIIVLNSTPQPSLIIQPKPELNLSVDVSEFVKAGCVMKDQLNLDCSAIGLEKRFSCERISIPNNALGGLSPRIPIVQCNFIDEKDSGSGGIVRTGCMLPAYSRYIVYANGDFQLLKNKEEFVKFFAPIETPEEALSLAAAITDSFPLYSPVIEPNYNTFLPGLEGSYAETVPEGFKVHLFKFDRCGCGPHVTHSLYYFVTPSGEIEITSTRPAYADPALDGLCVD